MLTSSSSLSRQHALRLALALLAAALVLRAPVVSISPLVGDISDDFGVGQGSAGLLTSIPVLCFGVGALFLDRFFRFASVGNYLTAGLLGIAISCLIRSSGGFALALLGTIFLGLSIAACNVAIPVLIGQRFPERVHQFTATYSTSLNVGAMLASVITVPVASYTGWRFALCLWGILAGLAGIFWHFAERNGPRVSPKSLDVVFQSQLNTGESVFKGGTLASRTTAGLAIAFGGQAFAYYAISAWLPSLLLEEIRMPTSVSGASPAIFQATSIVGSFGLSFLVARNFSSGYLIALTCSCWFALPLGLIQWPELWVAWCILGGVGQGAGFTYIFGKIASQVLDGNAARAISAMVQGTGYALGALGPVIVGFARASSQTWAVPMCVIGAAIITIGLGGWLAESSAHSRTVS